MNIIFVLGSITYAAPYGFNPRDNIELCPNTKTHNRRKFKYIFIQFKSFTYVILVRQAKSVQSVSTPKRFTNNTGHTCDRTEKVKKQHMKETGKSLRHKQHIVVSVSVSRQAEFSVVYYIVFILFTYVCLCTLKLYRGTYAM